MAEQSVVDELVVKLSLDAEQYSKAEAQVERQVAGTERKAQERARTTDRRDKDQQRRLRDTTYTVRAFATTVAAAGTVVAGLGASIGVSMINLLGFETGLRRQAVGTALSNREMQAWGATARRLGADAAAGAEAIAALAKERQQFELTGNAPTMQALNRMGVNTDRGVPIEDVIAQAQQLYRAAPAGQQQQFENSLAAQGVSADLILMIKSEIDARESYSRSFGQASEENRKALDDLADSLASLQAQAVSVASALLSAFMPAVERGAQWLGELSTRVATFANDVTQAGGGVEGFRIALERNAPKVATAVDEVGNQAGRLDDAIQISIDAFYRVRDGLGRFSNWAESLLDKVRTPWRTDGASIRDSLSQTRDNLRARLGMTGSTAGERFRQFDRWLDRGNQDLVQGARTRNEKRSGAWSSIVPLDESGSAGGPAGGATTGGMSGDAQSIMAQLVTQYGKTPSQAAAIVANWQRESGLRSNAFNPAGGGTGARGIAQWRGDRSQAFKARYGVMPDQASIAQQIEFAMTDPYERRLMMRSLNAGTDAQSMGVAYSKYYEAHGKAAEDARRGRDAAALERQFSANGGAGASGTTVSIQNMTVQTPDAAGFVGGLTRLPGSQNFNTVQR